MKVQPDWLNKDLYPFESKWIDINGHTQHYIDEGKGDIILFVHGTPEWSFGFRDQVRELRKSFRCIAIDHLGFGLSDKPASADYSVPAHSQRLSQFIEKVNLTNITIVANDFGGGIALGYALDNLANVERIVLFNTWMWSVKNDPHYAKPAKVIDSFIGRFLYLTMNAPVNFIMPAAFGHRGKLTREIHRHYRLPVPNAASRVALYEIAHELMRASEWWEALWQRSSQLTEKPMMILWGMKDKFVPQSEFEKWKAKFPKAKTMAFPDAGHFVQEEVPEMTKLIESFMKARDTETVEI